MSDPVLTYLQGDSQGAKRDMITRCYYEVAQGDPKSGPVAFAVVLNASAEQFAQTPKDLYAVVIQFQKVVTSAADLERRFTERVDQQNSAVVAAFKDETRRAREAWQATINQAEYVRERAKQLTYDMEPIVASAKRMADDFRTLTGDLKLHHESTQRIAEGVAKIETIHQDNQDLVTYFIKQARYNWMTIGFLAGIVFDGVARHLQTPSWAAWTVLALGAGLLQWLFRHSWNYVRRYAGKAKPSAAESNSAC